ncbi:MAG: VOC family protein [Steroidobacteraceae bacterium]|jgi:predicted enzyme related to lactoylglutathione lyase
MNVLFEMRRRCAARGLAALTAGFACALLMANGATAAALFQLPPITDSPSAEHHPGKVIWADLVTPDLAGAERFYGGLFGWTFQDIRVGNSIYAVATLGGHPIAGIFQKPIPAGEHRQPAWLTFIAVRSVEEARTEALAHGAKSLAPPKTYAGRGAQAVFTDPEGAVFAVLASSSGDSADYLAAPGEWIWSSLLTDDPSRSAAFYRVVFGYELFDLPSDDGAQHIILASDDYARAGIHTLPPGHHHPHWINFVRVADASRSAAQAVALGGRVLVEAHPDRHGGQVVVVADPTGAPVGLMEWSDQYTKDEAELK